MGLSVYLYIITVIIMVSIIIGLIAFGKYKLIIPILICFGGVVLIFNRIICPTYWKYPDILLENLELGDIQKYWGEFDVVLPDHLFEGEYSSNSAAYYLYTDEKGTKYYYMIQEVPKERYNKVFKGTIFVSNPREYFIRGEKAKYYDIETFAKEYVHSEGNICFPVYVQNGMEKMLQYFGVTKKEFIDYVENTSFGDT